MLEKRFNLIMVLVVLLFSFAVDCAHADLNTGLMAYYPLDGDTKDASGHGNDGEIHGAVSYVDGIIGQAASFAGSDCYIDIGNMKYLSKTDFSISLWVKKSGYGRYEGFIGKWNNSGADDNAFLLFNGEGEKVDCPAFAVYTKKNESHIIQSKKKILAGDFSHIVIWWSSSKGMKLYVNGLLEAQNDSLKGQEIKNDIYNYTAKIGQWGPVREGAYALQGILDDVRIYNRILSDVEIKKLYEVGKNSPSKRKTGSKGATDKKN